MTTHQQNMITRTCQACDATNAMQTIAVVFGL